MGDSNKKSYKMYPYSYLLGGKRTILIWQTSDTENDCFKIDENQQLISSCTVRGFHQFLGTDFDKVHWSEGAEVDFDHFWISLKNLRVGRSSSVRTCERLLNGWNFFEDLLYTFDLKNEIQKLKTPILNKVYKKIFYGNNISAVTPRGKSYNPLWTSIEIKELRETFREIWKFLIERRVIIR